MKVSKEIQQKWEPLKEKGDNAKLAKLLNIKPQSVANLFCSGVMTPTQIKVISAFYAKKVKSLKVLAQEID